MKTCSTAVAFATLVLAFWTAGCGNGKPKGLRAEAMRPDQIHKFAVLYRENCSACHGENGQGGAALPLHNPVYLAWAGRERMIQIVTNGIPHTMMPGFGPSGGGLLTNVQVANIVDGMIFHWGKPEALKDVNFPRYAATSKGDAAAGKAVYKTYCARCHGAGGYGAPAPLTESARLAAAARPGKVVGSIVNPTYLSLISAQGLRDIVVSGMPSEGMPDWRHHRAAKPMTNADIDNVLAWIRSKRVKSPGQPFPQLFRH